MLNATHLFEKPARDRHNSESWWSAFFSLVLLYRARTDPPLSLPIYTYTAAAGYRTVGYFPAKGFSFATAAVEAPLSATAFGLAAWPIEFLGLKPDLSVIEPERQHALFIETKTIGGSVAQKVSTSWCASISGRPAGAWISTTCSRTATRSDATGI
jgi:hypothetical protein